MVTPEPQQLHHLFVQLASEFAPLVAGQQLGKSHPKKDLHVHVFNKNRYIHTTLQIQPHYLVEHTSHPRSLLAWQQHCFHPLGEIITQGEDVLVA